MTTISTLGQALDQMANLNYQQQQLSTLQTQVTTGHKGQTYQALGTGSSGAAGSMQARASFTKLDTYIGNITTANTHISLMTTALGEIRSQASNMAQALNISPADGTTADIAHIADTAGDVSGIIGDLVNSKDGNTYLFSGSDKSNAPLGNDTSLDTYLNKQVTGWINGTVTTDQLIQSYRDKTQLNDTTVGYSAALSSGSAKNVAVRADDNADLNYTTLGNNDAMRDAIVATNMIRTLCSSVGQIASTSTMAAGTKTAPGATPTDQSANFYKVLGDLTTMVNTAMSKLDGSNQNLAQVQAQITQMSKDHATDQSTLTGTMQSIENVDMNEAAVKLSNLQTQLQASYSVTASVNRLSLVDYLK